MNFSGQTPQRVDKAKDRESPLLAGNLDCLFAEGAANTVLQQHFECVVSELTELMLHGLFHDGCKRILSGVTLGDDVLDDSPHLPECFMHIGCVLSSEL